MKNNNLYLSKNLTKGQSVVELVFTVGLIILVVTGVIVLLVNTIGAKTKVFDRRKAVQMAQVVMEDLVSRQKNQADIFWQLNSLSANDFSGLSDKFVGYTCEVDFTNISGNPSYPNCGVGRTDCTEATLTIDWRGKTPQTVTFTRFFSKNE